MNTFVVVAAFLTVAVCAADERGPRDEAFKVLIQDCEKSSGATEADIKAFMSRKSPMTKSGWCLIGCIKKKTGVLTASNQFDLDKFKETMSGMKSQNADLYNKIITVMTDCKKEAEADPKNMADECTAAEAMGKCFYTKKAAAGIP